MEMTRPAVRRFVAKPPFTEIDPPGDAIVDHPLERPIHRRAADSRKAASDSLEELVGTDVPRLVLQHIENLIVASRMAASHCLPPGGV